MTVEHRDARGLNDIELELVHDGHRPAFPLHRKAADKDRLEPTTVEQRIVAAIAQAEKPRRKPRSAHAPQPAMQDRMSFWAGR